MNTLVLFDDRGPVGPLPDFVNATSMSAMVLVAREKYPPRINVYQFQHVIKCDHSRSLLSPRRASNRLQVSRRLSRCPWSKFYQGHNSWSKATTIREAGVRQQ